MSTDINFSQNSSLTPCLREIHGQTLYIVMTRKLRVIEPPGLNSHVTKGKTTVIWKCNQYTSNRTEFTLFFYIRCHCVHKSKQSMCYCVLSYIQYTVLCLVYNFQTQIHITPLHILNSTANATLHLILNNSLTIWEIQSKFGREVAMSLAKITSEGQPGELIRLHENAWCLTRGWFLKKLPKSSFQRIFFQNGKHFNKLLWRRPLGTMVSIPLKQKKHCCTRMRVTAHAHMETGFDNAER